MAKVIALFNHKGGVGKTTNAFHIAWKIAESGKKVLMVDTDPQCNLTGLTLGIDDYDGLFSFYTSGRPNNLYTALEPFFNGKIAEIQPCEITKTKNQNLFILPGHVDISEFDDQISTAVTLKGAVSRMTSLVGMYNNLIRKTSEKHNIDVVFLDMSPSISATNRCLLMGSDYFIVPTAPDFFSHQAIHSLSSVLPLWDKSVEDFRDNLLLPRSKPKMLGTLLQNYRRYAKDGEKKMAHEYSKWADRIRDTTNNKLVSALSEIDSVISEDRFKASVGHEKPYNLGEIQDFNTLIPISQVYSTPIYALTEKELSPWSGIVLESAISNVKEAELRYTQISKSVIELISKN